VSRWTFAVAANAASTALAVKGSLGTRHVCPHQTIQRVFQILIVIMKMTMGWSMPGLYYEGSELLRPWMSDIHIGFGLCLPFLFLVHFVLGRNSV
jgi:hypothetical protein